MTTTMTSDPPLIVTGFHRSGTSAAARLLGAAGLDLGHRLVGRRRSNPHGHFEDASVVALHDEALAATGRAWDTDDPSQVEVDETTQQRMASVAAGRTAPWGFKDPRACFFVDAWARVVGTPRVLVMYRSPGEAAASLLRREARRLRSGEGDLGVARRLWADPRSALRSWAAHNRAVLNVAERHPGAVMAMAFDSLGSGAPLVSLVEERWGLGLQDAPTFGRVDPRWPGTATPALRSLAGLASDAELEAIEASLAALEPEGVGAGA